MLDMNALRRCSRLTGQVKGRVRSVVRTWEAMRLSLVKGAEGLGSTATKVTGAKLLTLRIVLGATATAKNLAVGKRLPSVVWEVQSSTCPLWISGLGGHIPFCLFQGSLHPLLLSPLRDNDAFFRTKYSDGHREKCSINVC